MGEKIYKRVKGNPLSPERAICKMSRSVLDRYRRPRDRNCEHEPYNTWRGYSSRDRSRPRSALVWWPPRVVPCARIGGCARPVDADRASWLERVASVSTWWSRHRPGSCASRRPDSPPGSRRLPARANTWLFMRMTDRASETRPRLRRSAERSQQGRRVATSIDVWPAKCQGAGG